MYSGDPEFPGNVEEENRSYYKDDTQFITMHTITLGTAKDKPVEPENVNGHITWGTVKVVFEGVRRVRKGLSSDKSIPYMESYWEVLLTEDENGEVWLDMEGNTVGAAVALDDNGYPFLVFDWSHPPGCHSSWSGYYVGKRLVEGKGWRLTDEEQGRLGIGISSRRVAKEGRTGVIEEENGCHSSDEDGSSGEDASESGEEEDAASEDVKGKRKASKGETGANKRRRA